jgi:hypothetical protein
MAQTAPPNASTAEVSKAWFADPPLRYRPAATVKVGLTPVEGIPAQLQTVVDRGFGSLMISPGARRAVVDPTSTRDPTIQRVIRAARKLAPHNAEPDPLPDIGEGPSDQGPLYLSEEYFRRYAAALAFAHAHGMTTVLYDELDYPSGFAGGGRIDPSNYRKLLVRSKLAAAPGAGVFTAPPGVLVAAVAMNETTKQRIDLTAAFSEVGLVWTAPGPGWTIQFFDVVTSQPQGGAEDYHAVADYLDPKAVQQFIGVTYEAYARHVGQYFGNTVAMTFFDDVGIYSADRTWAVGVGARFKADTGRDAALYYPALWEDIGPDTAAARIGLFAARAELLADGYPRLVSQWAARHGVAGSGHTPGQYEVQPTDMNGDPFKFYRAQPIPMIDVIFTYGFGRDGYKLTTSAAESQDKPMVAAEQFTTCGTPTGYKRAMDSLVRGVSYLITCTRNDIGPPKQFADWVGRSSMLLRGGRRVADIGVVYPIASLQAFYRFDAPDNQEGPTGRYAPASADYLAVGDRLTGDLHRDFTFLHPDDLASRHLKIVGKRMILDNAVERQSYGVLVLPGGEVISTAVLRKLKAFYDAGGVVLATTQLPTRSAEFGHDAEVLALVRGLFGTTPSDGRVRRNPNGGAALFIADPTPDTLRQALDRLGPPADIAFAGDPHPRAGNGELAYIHKVKAGRDIVFIANSSDEPVDTAVSLRGAEALELWDPYTGETRPAGGRVEATQGGARTVTPLRLAAGRSVFLIGERKRATP